MRIMPDAEEVKSNEWSRNKQGTEGFFGKNSSHETLEALRISPPKKAFNFQPTPNIFLIFHKMTSFASAAYSTLRLKVKLGICRS